MRKYDQRLVRNVTIVGHPPSDVPCYLIGRLEHTPQEMMRLLFLDDMEFLHAHSGSDDGVQHSSIIPEAISIGRQSKGIDPSYNFAAESEEGPVRVY